MRRSSAPLNERGGRDRNGHKRGVGRGTNGYVVINFAPPSGSGIGGTRLGNTELAAQRERPELNEAEDRHDAKPGGLRIVCPRQHALAKVDTRARGTAV